VVLKRKYIFIAMEPLDVLKTLMSEIKAEVSDISSRIETGSYSSKGVDMLMLADEPNTSQDSESLRSAHQAYSTEISRLKIMLERDLHIIEEIFQGKVKISSLLGGIVPA
jgi:hypothetical protein